MALTNTECKNAKTNPDKAYKLTDEKGLYLLIHKNGSKYFRFDYRFNGKRKTLAIGVYPEVSLKEARIKRDNVRKQIADGTDPSLTRKIEKIGSKENTFQAVAEEFLSTNNSKWSKSHHRHIKECFERDVYPWIGSRTLKDLSAVEVLTTLRRIVDRGATETGARTKLSGTALQQDAPKGT